MVHLCDVASTAVDNLEFMFQARFESLILLNRRLKDDVAKKNMIIEGSLIFPRCHVHSRCC